MESKCVYVVIWRTLQGNGITSETLDEFGNLTNLTNLDLENNKLTR